MSNSTDRPVHPIWSIPPAWPTAGGVAGSSATPAPVVSTILGIGMVLAIFAPWLVHLLPVAAAPLGPVLLPIFYAPMLAALTLRLPVAVAVSVATPIISRYLTGMPPEVLVPSLVLQIAFFVVAIRMLRSLPWVAAVPIAYVIGLVSATTLTQIVGVASVDVAGTVQTGWPGIAILTGLGWLADRLLRGTTQ